MGRTLARRLAIGITLASLVAASPSRAEELVYYPDVLASSPLAGALEIAPLFIVEGAETPHNRIGTPTAEDGWAGTRIRVDPERPTLYVERRADRIGGRDFEHRVTRVHFEKIPFRLGLHVFEAHRNPGLIVVDTIDVATGRTWLVTVVHTCGCYRATVPTTALPSEWLPLDHPEDSISVYGVSLPAMLPVPGAGERWAIRLMADRHRVIGISTPRGIEGAVPAPLAPMAALRTLPVAGSEPARTESFYYESGPLRGHVRGAWNAFEGLTLGWIALDPSVGMDKDFGDPDETGTPFYTMLRIWKQDVSRLDRFEPLLRELGFRIP